MTEGSNNVGVFKAPSDIHFMGHEKTASPLIPHASVELMRMSRDGIWVNPDIPVDEAAKQVLEILDNALKNMVRIAVEEEREACAQVCERHAEFHRKNKQFTYASADDKCAFAIRERGAP
jgi:hypothetical protein